MGIEGSCVGGCLKFILFSFLVISNPRETIPLPDERCFVGLEGSEDGGPYMVNQSDVSTEMSLRCCVVGNPVKKNSAFLAQRFQFFPLEPDSCGIR